MNTCTTCGKVTPGVMLPRPGGVEVFSPDNHRAPCGARCHGGGVKVLKGSHRKDMCGTPYCGGGVRS